MKTAIAIPARYGSSRFPGKPLVKIAGETMLSRVVTLAKKVAQETKNTTVFVTTEDHRVAEHAESLKIPCLMTSTTCKTGSDRVLAALRQLNEWPDMVLNLQGDAPFTPPSVLVALIETFHATPRTEVITPVHRLSWPDLDRLREIKRATPFSGTTALIDPQNRALWFSKAIIPAIRDEDHLRTLMQKSPVYQHMGLYGFRPDILEKFCALPQSPYEKLEGLEQLRMLENGIRITTVPVDMPEGFIQSGIDTPDDVKRAEFMIRSGYH